jgi:predicted HTH transcriptional regulator
MCLGPTIVKDPDHSIWIQDMPCRQDPKIREFVLKYIADNPKTITMMTAKNFEYSRTGVARYLNRLVDEGVIAAEGTTRARVYTLSPKFLASVNVTDE